MGASSNEGVDLQKLDSIKKVWILLEDMVLHKQGN